MYKNSIREWIPVEERCPKAYGEYLVSIKNESVVKINLFYDGKFDEVNVIAWRQLPLPYQK